MIETKTISVDEIQEPERSEKLHPIENDNDDDWKAFKASVGTEPNKPLEVRKNGKGYELIDGDRRLRAIKENGGTEARCDIHDEMDDDEFYLRRIRANEARKKNDPVQRSWYTAQFVAPHLLPPGERRDVSRMDQYEYADQIGVSQPTISNWLGPMRDRHPIRAVLGTKTDEVDEEDLEIIDETKAVLTGRDGSGVIPDGQEGWAADQLADMKRVSLKELHKTAKKASDEKWSLSTFLEYLDEHFAGSSTGAAGQGINSGVVGTFDDSPEQTRDGDPERVANGEGTSPTSEDRPNPDPEPETDLKPEIDVTWEDHVSDDDMPGDTEVSMVAMRRMGPPLTVEDEVRVAIELIAETEDMEQEDVIQNFFGPVIVDAAIEHFQD